MPTRKERERAERQRLILHTARSVAEAEGWDAVTTRRLADEIEYSQPVIYSHFASRGEILAAVAVDGFAELAEALSAAEGPDGVVDTYLDFSRRNPALYAAMFGLDVDLKWGTDAAPPPLLAAFGQLREALRPLAGDRDLEAFTEICWAALHGAATLESGGRLRPDLAGQRRSILLGLIAG